MVLENGNYKEKIKTLEVKEKIWVDIKIVIKRIMDYVSNFQDVNVIIINEVEIIDKKDIKQVQEVN